MSGDYTLLKWFHCITELLDCYPLFQQLFTVLYPPQNLIAIVTHLSFELGHGDVDWVFLLCETLWLQNKLLLDIGIDSAFNLLQFLVQIVFWHIVFLLLLKLFQAILGLYLEFFVLIADCSDDFEFFYQLLSTTLQNVPMLRFELVLKESRIIELESVRACTKLGWYGIRYALQVLPDSFLWCTQTDFVF